MYKLIFIDLDGTLLNDKKEISEENIKWLNRAYKEKGITTIITTGRQLGFVKDLYNRYNCSFGDYVIASNGAIIKNIKIGEYVNKEVFSKEEVKDLRKIYKEENLEYFMIYTENESYRENNSEKETLEQDKILVENIDELLERNSELIVSLCIFGGEEERLIEAIKKVEKINKFDNSPICVYNQTINEFTINEKYFDVMRKNCNKKNAVKKVMDTFGVNHDEIIVIGDGGNDLPMFEYAKLKIAMGNADEALKLKADYITDTNNNDGVAKAIKKFVFEELEFVFEE